MGIAKKVKDVSDNFRGEAALYQLEPPFEHQDWDDDALVMVEYVIASSVSGPFATETMVFESNEAGDVVSWSDLCCLRGVLDHEAVLMEMGYGEVILCLEP